MTFPDIDSLMRGFDGWCACGTEDCQLSGNYEKAKQSLNLYIEERERKARLGEVKLAHHVIFPDLGVLTSDLIDNYLLKRIKELEG